MNSKARKLQAKLDREIAWSRQYKRAGLDMNRMLSDARIEELKRELARVNA